MVSYPSGFSKTEMKKILPMSIVSSLSSNHSIISAYHPNTIDALHLNKEETLPISLTKSQKSNPFDHDYQTSDKHFPDIFHRLSQQKSRLIRLYDREIERRQGTSQLLTFINKIDQLIDEYDSQVSSNLSINDPTNSTKQLDDVLYSTYFNGRILEEFSH